MRDDAFCIWLLRSFYCHNDVIFFSFTEKEVFAEDQIVGCNCALETYHAEVIQIYAAAFDVLSGQPFGSTQARQN